MRAIGIVPARGGSKGVPRKNLRSVGGHPLLWYTFEAARRSRRLTSWVLSTEDAEIAAFGEEQGAAVVSRPAHLAGDDSETIDAVVHALSCVEDTGAPFDQVVVLQPTSPFRTADDIDAALSLLGDSGADSVVSVYEVGDVHPARMYRLEGERLEPYASEASTLRQRLPVLFHRNGAIYACRRSLVAESRSLIGADTRPLVMPRDRSVNIDDEFDLRVADLLLSHEP